MSFRNNSKLSEGEQVSVRRHVAAVSIRALTLVVGWVYVLRSAGRQGCHVSDVRCKGGFKAPEPGLAVPEEMRRLANVEQKLALNEKIGVVRVFSL